MRDVRAELRELRAETRSEFRALRAEMDRRFTWTIGLLVAVLIAVLSGMASLAFQISRLQPI
jgi:hypothetical protein